MKMFAELTREQQTAAERKCLEELVQAIVEGGIRFNDAANGDDLQARIDIAMRQAERMRTPWFAAEMILDDSGVREQLESMARCDAEDALYPEPGERVIRGIAAE